MTTMVRLQKRRLVQKGFEQESERGTIHMLHMSLRRDISTTANAAFELLKRGVALCEVASLSGLPEHSLSHLLKSRGAQVRRAGRAPRNLDVIVKEPLTHLQLSAFLVGLDLQRSMAGKTTLDVETYLSAIVRTERAGMEMAPTIMPYVSLVVHMWEKKEVVLQTCRCCSGTHLVVREGTTYSITRSKVCPFCSMAGKIRDAKGMPKARRVGSTSNLVSDDREIAEISSIDDGEHGELFVGLEDRVEIETRV